MVPKLELFESSMDLFCFLIASGCTCIYYNYLSIKQVSPDYDYVSVT
jgi:hypothetical protein